MQMQSKKSSQGFGVIEILVVVVVLAILGAGAYLYFQQAQSNKTSDGLTNQEKAEIQAACKLEVKDDLLCSVFANWGEDSEEPVTITTTVTSEGQTSTSVMKTEGENSHTTSSYGGEAYESILLDDVMYTKMDGVWYKQAVSSEAEASSTVPDSAEPDQVTDEIISKDEVDKVEYKKLGNEECGDETCVKYQISTKDAPEDKTYLWIDPNKNRIMRMQSQSDSSTFDLVYEYGPVTITAPADAKDYSEMFSM